LAETIRGINIVISGNTTALTASLTEVNRASRNISGELRHVQNLLRMSPGNTTLIRQQQELLGQAVENTRERLDRLRAAEQQVREQFSRGEISGGQMRAFERELQSAEINLNRFENRLEETQDAADSLADTLQNAGEKMKGVGESMTMGLTAPIAAAGAIMLKGAIDAETATGKLQAQLGITAEEAVKLGDVAQEVWKTGFGENIDEATEAIKNVRLNMGNLAEDELQSVAQGALVIASVFDAEVTETTAAAGVMMKNFGISGQDALDLITTGFQKGGNYSDELIDTLREYSPYFASMGFSAQEAMEILISGAEAGAWSLDKVGDAIKEFGIRSKDASDTTMLAFEGLGLDAVEMTDAFAAGGESAQQAFAMVTAALAAESEEVQRNAYGVMLFGTQYEDLEKNVIQAMAESKASIDGFSGATQEAAETMKANNPGLVLTAAMRKLQAAIGPALLPLASMITDTIVPAIKGMVEVFTSLSPAGQDVVLIIAGIAAAIGPALITIGNLSVGLSAVMGFFTAGATGVSAFSAAMAVITGPIGIAVAAIVGIGLVIKNLWDTNEQFRTNVIAIWEDIKTSAETIFNTLKEFWKEWGDELISIITPTWETLKSIITAAITIIGEIISLALNVITGDWSGAWDNIKNIFSAAWDGIKAYASGLGETMKAIFGTIAAMAISWGGDIISGLVNGITSKLQAAKNAALSVARNIKDAITNFFDIKSPSEVTKRLGEYIAEGLAKGIEGKTSDAEKAAQKLAQAVQSAISKVLSDIDKTFQIQTAKLELEILTGGANMTEIQRLEDELKKLQLRYDQSTEKIEALNDVLKTAKDKLGENSDTVKDYKQQLELAKIAHEKLSIEISNNRFAQEKAAIKENIEALQELSEAAKETYEETIKSATENYKKLEELNREIVDLAKEERDEKIQAANDYSDAQKEYYDEIYDKAKETYDNTVQRARDSYNSIIDAAVFARDTELAALQGQLDAINDEEEQRDKDAERQELETAITKARTTRERTEAEAALAEWLRKQEIEEKKESITAQMEQVKADYEEKESLAEKQLEYVEDAAEKALSRAEERYERDTENLERETENKLRIIEEQYQEKLTLAEADLANAKSMYDQEEAKAKATFAAITGYMIDRYDAEKEKQDELKQNMNEYYEELARLSAEYERQKAAGNMEAANAVHEQANKIRTDAGISSYYDSTTGAVLATPTANASTSVSPSSGSSSGGQNYVTYNGRYGYWNNFGEFTEVSKYGTGAIVGRPTMGIFGDVPEAIMPLTKLPSLMTEALLGAVQILSPSQSAISMAGAGATSNSYNFSFTGPISIRDDSDITQLSRELYNLSQNAARVRGVR